MASKSSWDVLTTNDGDVLENGDGPSSKRFSIRNYVPAKSNISFVKAILIGGGVIAAILIIVVTSVVLRSKQSQRVAYYELMLSDGNKLWEIDPNTMDRKIRHTSRWDVNTFDIYKGSLLYGHNASVGAIFLSALNSERLDPTTSNVIFNQTNLMPDASAIDFLTGNLYLVDTEIGGLIVFNMHTKYSSLIFSGLDKPTDVVLDPYEGVMFVAQKGDSILRMNMDGSGITKIVNDSDASHLSIDHNSKRLYWINDYISIESSDYDGENKRVIMSDSKAITSFAVIENRLVWLWGYSKEGTMAHCTLGVDGCESLKDEGMFHFANPRILKNIPIHKNDSVSEACEVNNGGCDHLCLAKPGNQRTCVCNVGWQLTADGMNCRVTDSIILYSTPSWIKGRIPYNAKTESVDAIWPVAYNMSESILSFDYDVVNDDFFFNNMTHIYRMKLKKPSEVKLLYTAENNTKLQGIAYDWSTENLYFNTYNSYNETLHTTVLKVRQPELTKVIYTSARVDFSDMYLYRVLLNVKKGYFVVSGKENWKDRVLERMTMNGTKVPLSYEQKYVKTMDVEDERLYADVYGRRDPRVFEHFNVNDNDIRKIEVKTKYDGTEIVGISVEEQWLYFQTEKAIYRCNKDNGKSLKRIVPEHPDVLPLTEKFTFMKVISTSPQMLEKNPCWRSNGGCKEFCFVVDDKAKCDCQDGKVVQQDGSCV